MEEEKAVNIHAFCPEVYPRALFIVEGEEDLSFLNDIFTTPCGEPMLFPSKNDIQGGFIDAATYKHVRLAESGKFGALVVLFPNDKRTVGQIAHEAVHVANGIFEDLGIDGDYGNDESYAYFVQWVVNCIASVDKELREKNKKDEAN